MFDALSSWSNLLRAYRRAATGKRGKPSVAAFEHRLEEQLLALQRELREGSYRPGAYTHFQIHEPKRRLISAAPFRDRVVHHALCNIIEPTFERSFVSQSFANRRGKGTHRALAAAQALARRHRYVLQCDVRQFFPSIDHAILRATIASKVDDERVLSLVDVILASGADAAADVWEPVLFPGDDLLSVLRPRGLPIGNLTSQFWANVFLNPFDHFVTRELRCSAYVRYVDDMLLFHSEKATLFEWRAAMFRRLEAFRLTFHAHAQPRLVADGIPFLGFIVLPERRRLKRRKGLHFRRKLVEMLVEHRQGSRATADVSVRVRGWINHVRYANTIGLRRAVFRDAARLTAARLRALSSRTSAGR